MASGKRQEELEVQIKSLHSQLEKLGVNSSGQKDIFGRSFDLPVDAEHKATAFAVKLFRLPVQPHMYAFWAATFGFFCTFFAVFAPAALLTWIKEDESEGGLGLTPDELSSAGAAAVGTTVAMRFLAGPLCDKFGARKTMGILLFTALPGLVVLATAQNANAFIAGRALIGLSLASFVTCQVWCSQMFTKSIVGTVNATAGGWGNLGGGVTLLVMPQIMVGFLKVTDQDTAWRLCMIVPAAMIILATLLVMKGRDLPDGNYKELEMSGAKQKGNGSLVFLIAACNINTIPLMICYATCFGVELTMNNKAVLYFYEYYDLSKSLAGVLGACFGLMNLFARSWGGLLSDWTMKKFGIRGRVWSLFVVQVFQGFMCLTLGLLTVNMPGPVRMERGQASKYPASVFENIYNVTPEVTFHCYGGYEGPLFGGDGDFCKPKFDKKDPWKFSPSGEIAGARPGENQNGIYGAYKHTVEFKGGSETTTYVVKTKAAWIPPCASKSIDNPGTGHAFSADGTDLGVEKIPTDAEKIVVGDVWNPDCVRNTDGALGKTMAVIIFFSIGVQMAEGLTYGVVPYVSRPALGAVAGMVGAGGNLGAVIGSKVIIANANYDQGFVYLGMVILIASLSLGLVYFKGEDGGGMFLKPGALGKFDPQLWMPKGEEMRGADQMDYSSVAIPGEANKPKASTADEAEA
ncbi:hypothetical protein EMIHUDRAFT_440685 [Emiliania huxleyi CCMP1516]|uniref:Major facilitator superfamily (MFS) profile domain-containing protein n=2 Tax=Emiliania huxleyi TaxID=2903 RepID=A0A0D3KK60_EMIH1|nr:hypothetical protein EMIHUDRAFT_440685 [Emiliania huxleyi CCMP1516]EOD36145.1 hypothetical protein EMIHUDRAFT_440685 [Emiliania huxleyi CCMP1516]|eukprot:XP_005788574.1 hypothetical protein EMIHUDRAFT_440685 [Emiliania huxleyi CCMP1516]